jgi:hypothetical protein
VNFRIEGLGDWFCDRTSYFARGNELSTAPRAFIVYRQEFHCSCRFKGLWLRNDVELKGS